MAQWGPCLTGCFRVMQAIEQVVLAEGHLCFVFLILVWEQLHDDMDPHCLDIVAWA